MLQKTFICHWHVSACSACHALSFRSITAEAKTWVFLFSSSVNLHLRFGMAADVMCCKQCNLWRRQGAQCWQIGNGEVSYQSLKMVVFGGYLSCIWQHWVRSTNDCSLYSQSSRKNVERKGDTISKTCKGVITSLWKTQRNTNIRRSKIPEVFGIPAGRIF